MKPQVSTSLDQVQSNPPQLYLNSEGSLFLKGNLSINYLSVLEKQFKQLEKKIPSIKSIEADQIDEMDTAGALVLIRFYLEIKKDNPDIKINSLSEAHETLITLIFQKKSINFSSLRKPKSPGWVYGLGKWGTEKNIQAGRYLSFLGESVLALWALRLKTRDFHWRYVLSVINQVGCGSLPIVALMLFLVGIVLTYQLAVELQLYGADIYVVDASGIAILREFSPLITAIILAGKTSTSFAALIGSMKINEEVDALITMGIPPIQRLVLPRIIALIIVMPLLTVWASIFGVLGSMLMAAMMLKINYVIYLQRFVDMVSLQQYVLGMIKAPFFALIISLVGCFQGLQVSNSADSVGAKTTHAAVQAIFLIIIADALFSIVYSWKGL